MSTRDEHLRWVKQRALAELRLGGGGIPAAIASVTSDLAKHPDTQHHDAILGMTALAAGGDLNTVTKVRAFIRGLG